MTSDGDFRFVQPALLAWVYDDSRWWPGQVNAWRRDGAGWRAHCYWIRGVGEQHVGWFPAELVRERQADDAPPLPP